MLTRRLLARASQDGRVDDTADVIGHRLQVFAAMTGPLVAYYTERGILVAVDADQLPESVTAEIEADCPNAPITDHGFATAPVSHALSSPPGRPEIEKAALAVAP